MKGKIGQRVLVVVGFVLALTVASNAAALGDGGAQSGSLGAGVAGGDSVAQGSYLAFSFADGLDGTAQFGLPALSARGLAGVSFVPTAMVGTQNHMVLGDLTALAAAGWDVASHLDTGADCTKLPRDELRRRLHLSHDWLVAHGFAAGARIFGPPGQKWTVDLTPLAVEAGYEMVAVKREMGGIVPQNLNLVYAGCANRNSLTSIAAAINSAKTHPGTLLLLSFHDIVQSNPVGTDADVGRLQQVLDLAVSSGLPIVTISDLMAPIDPADDPN